MAAHNELGAWGEAYVAHRIQTELGGQVCAGIFADLRWQGVEIEVKTAKPSIYNGQKARGFQFCIKRRGRQGLLGEVLVLVHVVKGKPVTSLVIPAKDVGQRSMIKVPFDIASSRYAAYENQWPLLLTYCAQHSTVKAAD